MTEGLSGHSSPSTIIFFDGVCNFCNALVNWLIDHDQHRRLHFAPLQGATYAALCKQRIWESDAQAHHHLHDLSSIVVYSEGHIFVRSAAVLQIAWLLGGIWRSMTWLLRFMPAFMLDTGYDVVARNRYRLFGKQDQCRVPTPELQARFLA
jgi:predicted DCC family thiol-disulfide oxidoreductase YuxK